MAKPLVIVESPAKARTLARFLGPTYRVEASYGHVRDLPESASEVPKTIKDRPWGRLAVDVDSDFAPHYVVPSSKRKHVQALKAALKGATELVLATDPDREGESISWHLTEVLKPGKDVRVRRIVFHEITEDAIREALAEAHAEVDHRLVDAQEARRILDRLYGYTLSPLLWKKVQTGLSAGRVQSVAVRLIVEREQERRAFTSSAYWDLEARLRTAAGEFSATLVRVGDQRLATGRDFEAATGRLETQGVRVLAERDARQMVSTLDASLPWRVSGVDERPATQRPAPPFTTSTLQQEANRKLGYSAERTMQIAQRLFQGVEVGGGELEGLITYHRTDSTTLSEKALRESARVIREKYGAEYYAGPRQYQTRVRNAQEAHEAIRPTDFRLAPQQLTNVLDSDDLRLYELVWKRTMASQMTDARLLRTTLEITATDPEGTPHVFVATGKAIRFPGFLRAYVEGSDDPAAELGDQETLLPRCEPGDRVGRVGETRLQLAGLDAKGHETSPPARYTEASLVKRLEEDGIGRPSTYAPTIATVQRRGYVFRQGKALVPSFTAFAVTALLKQYFDEYVDLGFTAKMEELLDDISNGRLDQLTFLKDFYRGGGDEGPGLEPRVQEVEGRVEYPVIDVGRCPKSGEPIRVRIGRFGPFLQRGEGGPGNTASLPDDLPPADLSVERAVELLEAKAAGPRQLGTDPQTGEPIYLATGRFGPYVQRGETPERGSKARKPARASLPSGWSEADLSLDQALQLLELPRVVGVHPDDNEPVVANFGRFGPYVKHGSEFRSLDDDAEVFAVTFDRALELLRQPKRSRRQTRAAKAVLRELGAHPESGAVVKVMSGRYGPYVTDGSTNATIPRGSSPESIGLDEAVSMLREKAAAGPSKRPRGRRAAKPGSKPRSRRKSAEV